MKGDEKVNLYILPIQRVLLEYVLKLGDMIFFPGNISNKDIECSSLTDDEKKKLRLVVKNNQRYFTKYLKGIAFLLMS